jgi:pheromone a factor receptor
MAWTGLACLNQFINSIVWNNNAINWAPVWCDISAKFIVGSAVAIPAASLCINRRLYHIASVKSVTVTRAEKRRQIMVDLAIGLGLPIMEMILRKLRCSLPFPSILTSH